jgi:hypothetical protein
MTSKDFRSLAFELARVRKSYDERTWLACVDAVAKACAVATPRFDRDRFIEACHMDVVDDGGPDTSETYLPEPYRHAEV